jgi:hypothetical protein
MVPVTRTVLSLEIAGQLRDCDKGIIYNLGHS